MPINYSVTLPCYDDSSIEIARKQLIVLNNISAGGGGGGGGNTTIEAPLGSRPAAEAVSVAFASDLLPVLQPTGGGNLSVQTHATGTNYVAFASQACRQLTIVNDSGADIVFQQGGTGAAVTVWDHTTFTIFGITNADQISVKRKDDSNTQVTVASRWENA